VVSIRWWRVAAAAVLLLGISTTAIILLNQNKTGNGGADNIVRKQPGVKKSNTIAPVTQPGVNPLPVDPGAIASVNDQQEDKRPVSVKEDKKRSSKEKADEQLPIFAIQEQPAIAHNDIISQPPNNPNNLPKPDYNPNVIGGSYPSITRAEISPEETLTTPRVTRDNPGAYNLQQKTADNPDKIAGVKYASDNDGQKGGGLRGFLRKVTRTFEKKTNIKATDDDERLLIAGLAIKLD